MIAATLAVVRWDVVVLVLAGLLLALPLCREVRAIGWHRLDKGW